ncbi:MAG: flippase-like domain-containing protein [Candidatus Bipolaricaulota bacterium]|nr:flippase-like domain-containing protein [Candidatus Bipolaricaulota bacterium]MDW8126938.1 flippase-like domain-containing protein [Candidatus Bipolaricaulota bacterium]
MRGFLALGLLLAGLGAFAALVVVSGPHEIWQAARALPVWALGVLFLLELLGLAFWAASWGVLLCAAGIYARPHTVLAAAIAGYAVSYLTPVSYLGGEPVRGWLVARRTKCDLSALAGTLVWDRVIAGITLLSFALAGGGLALPLLAPAQRIWVMLGLSALALAITLGALNFARGWGWLARLIQSLARRAGRARTRMEGWARKVTEMEQAMHHTFRRHFGAIVFAFFLQLLSFVCHYLRPLFYLGFAQERWLSLRELGVYFNLNTFLSLFLWVTPAGIGTAEGGRIGILSLFGVTPAAAMAFSLTYRFLELIFVGIGLGLILNASAGKRLRQGLGTVRGFAEIGNLLVYGLFLPTRVLPRFFNLRFRRPDPWDYAKSPYEQRKYQLMLDILPRRGENKPPYERALDLGCAEGFFTRRLVQERIARVAVGVDVAERAVARARACHSHLPVEFHLMDVGKTLPEGKFDLVFCSEVLYYLGYHRICALAQRLAEKMQPGGHLVLVSAWPAARLIHRPFLRHPAFKLVAEHVEPHHTRPYAINCLERLP